MVVVVVFAVHDHMGSVVLIVVDFDVLHHFQ